MSLYPEEAETLMLAREKVCRLKFNHVRLAFAEKTALKKRILDNYEKHRKPKYIRLSWLSAAACLLIFCFLGSLYLQYQEVSNVELSTSVLADVKVDPEQKEVELHLSKEKIQVTDNSTISVDKKGNVQVAEIEIKSIDRKQHFEQEKEDVYHYMMVGYRLENTLTENGHVARGVCVTDEEGHLQKIHERTHIERHEGSVAYTEDEGKTWTALPQDSTVSMNMWGFSESIMKELKARFPKFLEENLPVNPMKCEYFLPFVVDELLGENKATVKVLKSMDKWYGVTYKEDKPVVVAAIQRMKDEGLYPQDF